MSEAKIGDTVKVHYTGKLDDGTVFDSSDGRDPLEFKVGEKNVIPGFENAVVGMKAGDKTTTNINSNDAYGPHRPEMIASVPKTQLPKDMEPQVGMQMQMGTPDGQQMVVTVVEVQDEEIKLDANHPLAGKDLTFEIELVSVN